MTARQRQRLLLGAALVLSGCSSFRIPDGWRVGPGDWPQEGRDAERSAVTAASLPLPLTAVWDAGIGAGTGEGSPVTADSFVVVGTLRGELLVFHLRTGVRVGGLSFGECIPCSPALGESIVYIPLTNSSESVVAYDLLAGRRCWEATCGDITTSPLLVGTRLFVGTAAGDLLCLDAATGATVWRFSLPGNTRSKGIRSTPASDGTRILFGADDGWVYALDALVGTMLWRTDVGSPVMGGVAVAGGRVFGGTVGGRFFGVQTDDGSVRWTATAGHPVYAGVAVTEGLVIGGTTGGAVLAMRQTDGQVLWRRRLEGAVSATGAVSGAHCFVGTLARTISALRISDGTLAWSDSLEGRIKSAPAVTGGRLLILTDDRTLRAYGPGGP